MKRTTLSTVLGATDRAYRALKPLDRKIVKLGYFDALYWTDVSENLHMSLERLVVAGGSLGPRSWGVVR